MTFLKSIDGKDIAYSSTMLHRNAAAYHDTLKLIAVKEKGGCCNTCVHRRADYRYQLQCKAKGDKHIKPYNVCHHWKLLEKGVLTPTQT